MCHVRSCDYRGQYALLKAKADGLGQILNQCNRDSQAAFKLLMLDHLDHLSEQTAKAISNIKFDKASYLSHLIFTVQSFTSRWLSGMVGRALELMLLQIL